MRAALPGSLLRWAALAAATAVPRAAGAQPPAQDLMARLATYAAHFETLRTQATYSLEGRLETLDRGGRADSVKDMRARIEPDDGTRVKVVVLKYTEDGEDKTDDARRKARERASRPKSDKKPVRMPLLAQEQSRYVFDEVEVDRADPSRVRIAFAPKVPEEDTIEGSAWVDAKAGTLISAGFRLTKTPLFVDYVNFTVKFGEPTALGPAVSTVLVEGKGGLPFFQKRFRAQATLSDYRLAPL
ncbi:MAG TPA: hypothetical protein VKU41_02275 [Polyangiaceae bacterium]|nr:hypothetical protein [Polyangiaceae bacterium]